MSGHRASRQRLFFALWPDESVRAALARIARGLPRGQGRPVPAANLHITLAFAGAVEADTQNCLMAQAAELEARPCMLVLTRIGYFPRSRIVWLGADECPQALINLVRSLSESLENCGLKPDLRPYRPHVTLSRDVPPAPAPAVIEIEPVDWRIEKFYLMESQTRSEGVRYEIVQTCGLHA